MINKTYIHIRPEAHCEITTQSGNYFTGQADFDLIHVLECTHYIHKFVWEYVFSINVKFLDSGI